MKRCARWREVVGKRLNYYWNQMKATLLTVYSEHVNLRHNYLMFARYTVDNENCTANEEVKIKRKYDVYIRDKFKG